MGMPARSAKRWTANEARRLNEANPLWWPRYEVIDGELLVSPAPRLLHQRAVTTLLFLLEQQLIDRPGIEVLAGPADIELEPDSTLSPDIFVFPGVEGRRARHWTEVTSLLLVVEVLSPSTARNDRVTKRDYFLRNDVGEYWIVDLDARVVERWKRGYTRPDIVRDELRAQIRDDITIVIDVERFFARVCDE
jgi:Uma2 family endonuclease